MRAKRHCQSGTMKTKYKENENINQQPCGNKYERTLSTVDRFMFCLRHIIRATATEATYSLIIHGMTHSYFEHELLHCWHVKIFVCNAAVIAIVCIYIYICGYVCTDKNIWIFFASSFFFQVLVGCCLNLFPFHVRF